MTNEHAHEHRSRTYEALLATIQALARAEEQHERHIAWLTATETLGIARSPEGRVEIFLVGAELQARSARTRDNLVHQEWHRSEGRHPVLANRILLPPAGHFEQVAAFLCVELIRNGATDDVPGAFRRTEPVVELALERLRLADEDLVGLCGELVLLQALLRTADEAAKPAVVEAWRGHQRSTRDFELDGTGIEVKTTTGTASSHHMQGLHQIEAGYSADGLPEHAFFLASLGLKWTTHDQSGAAAYTLPSLVDSILDQLQDSDVDETIRNFFTEALSDYGTDPTLGYRHGDAGSRERYDRPFVITFARLYDMTDTNVRVLRLDDVRHHPFTDADSLAFRINLPDEVSGDLNPVAGLAAIASRILSN